MKKKELRAIVNQLLMFHASGKETEFWTEYRRQVLDQKITFAYLEFVADQFYEHISPPEVLQLAEESVNYGKVGGYVIASKILQHYLVVDPSYCYQKGIEYIMKGNEWYHCDIVGERIFGKGLLLHFNDTLAMLTEMSTHSHPLIKRAVGVAIHYAVKKGLEAERVPQVIELLLTQAKEKDLHVKKGCGWGIETIAKFHPTIIKQYESQLFEPQVNSWIKKKYQLGLKKGEKMRGNA